MVLVVVRPDHPLDREPDLGEVTVRRDHHVLEVVEQRRAVVPRHRGRAIDDVVAVQRRDRDEADVGDAQPGRPVGEVVDDVLEHGLVVFDEVHLVDAYDDVRDPQQRGDVGVPAGLLAHALAGIDEDDRQVRCRGARDHVARVLLVAGRVGDHELAPWRLEVPVGDVDRDPLLALGPEAVGQQREVHVAVAAPLGRLHHVLELVLEDRLGVVQQPPDQRRLAVVDRPGGGEPQQLAGAGSQRVTVGRRARRHRPNPGTARNSPRACDPPSQPRSPGHRRGSLRAR